MGVIYDGKRKGDEAEVPVGTGIGCTYCGPAADPSIPPLPLPEHLTGLYQFDDEEEGAVEDV